MPRVEVEGVGLATCDPDSSRLVIDGKSITDTSLARDAGCEIISDSTESGFESDDEQLRAARAAVPAGDVGPSDYTSAHWDAYHEQWLAEERAEYTEASGRKFPRVYRMRVVFEAEELSEDEAAAYWEARRAERRAQR